MTRDRATELGMKTARSIIPPLSEEQLAEIEKLLPLMWQAGAEHKSREIMTRHTTPVRMVDNLGRPLATFESLQEAAARTRSTYTGIKSALKRGSRTKTGHYWEYIETKN